MLFPFLRFLGLEVNDIVNIIFYRRYSERQAETHASYDDSHSRLMRTSSFHTRFSGIYVMNRFRVIMSAFRWLLDAGWLYFTSRYTEETMMMIDDDYWITAQGHARWSLRFLEELSSVLPLNSYFEAISISSHYRLPCESYFQWLLS